jgi:lantibiotic modifying enzyme
MEEGVAMNSSRWNRSGSLFVARRDFLKTVASVTSLYPLWSVSEHVRGEDKPNNSTYREAALGAARWLQSCKVTVGEETAWPADPRKPKAITADLYSGIAGVVLFFLEAHHATGDSSFLKDALRGADYLLAHLPQDKAKVVPGLYTGTAGIGFCLDRTFKTCQDKKYLQGAERCLQGIKDRAGSVGKGVEWSEATDIISGGAGIGLYLLHAAREWKDATCLDLAVRAGSRLIELGIPEQGGLKWRAYASNPRLMPNFSHGTAGVCYFLASLHQATKDKAFLDAALAGAKYLQAVANTEGNACRIFHHEPDGKDLYYLGWCHGSTGTARLFYRLYQVTNERVWMEWVHKCARAVLESGIPEKQVPGFWNNAGQCCGSAGVAEFFLNLYRVTKEPKYLKFCERMTADLLARATREQDRLKWVHAEYRVKPNEVAAQTGYMQGAAGIGMLLLHLDAFQRAKPVHITLPDSPF